MIVSIGNMWKIVLMNVSFLLTSLTLFNIVFLLPLLKSYGMERKQIFLLLQEALDKVTLISLSFVICIERLSRIIADQVDAHYWKPMHAGRYGPQISHLFLMMIFFCLQRPPSSKLTVLCIVLIFFAKLLDKRSIVKKLKSISLRMLINNSGRKFCIIQVISMSTIWAGI
jgi:hypothetical protein